MRDKFDDGINNQQDQPDTLANSGELTTADLAGVRDANKRKAIVAGPGNQPDGREAGPAAVAERAVDAAPAAAAAAPARAQEELGPLFSGEEANNLRARWDSVQVGFVDEPRQAVQEADQLIAATMKRLAEVFADERQKLEKQWDRGDNVSTEDLRQALRRYRSFFSRLLKV